MSQNQKIRSKLMIDAVVQAAATGAATALHPPKKIAAIAGLAGFVLRMFRSREPLPPGVAVPSRHPRLRGSHKTLARIQPRSSKAVRSKASAAIMKGGNRRG